jgi:hypothetical protein
MAGTFRAVGQVGGAKCSTQPSARQRREYHHSGKTAAGMARLYNISAAAVSRIFADYRIVQS